MTVKQRQHLLAYLDYYAGNVDGDWGTLSQTACSAFQDDFGGIEVDGYGGPITDKALRHAVAYDMFQVADSVDTPATKEESGTFWDEIQFFTRDELKCKCGGRYCNGFPAEPQELLVRLAERARVHFGAPAHNVSCLRCPTWNAESDGVANSQHMYGEAMDIRIDGVTADQLLAFFKKQPEVRYCYKINSTNVHFDIPKGKR